MSPRKPGTKRVSPRWGRVALWLILAIVIALAAGIGTGALPLQFKSAKRALPPQATELTHVGAWGRLAPRGEVRSLAAPSSSEGARLMKLDVVEGDRVSEGQLIAILDSHERRSAAVEHARSLLALAEAKLEQVRVPAKLAEIEAQAAQIARLQYELTQAEVDLKREESLGSQKINVQSALEQTRLKWQQAVQNKRQSEAELEALKTPRPTDVVVAERQVDEARAALKQAEADLSLAEIRSPCAATVLRIHARAGERIGDLGVVSIGDLDQMYAIAEVYEADLGRLQIGQTARVRIPTLKLELRGEIERLGLVVQRKDVFNIDPVADTDARVIEVWVKLAADAPQSVRQLSNARVEVVFDVGERPQAETPASQSPPADHGQSPETLRRFPSEDRTARSDEAR